MKSPGDLTLLRPLSLGEIFDRAVTLYVRNLVPFTLIALVVVLPMAVMSYFAGLHQSETFAQILSQVEHPAKTPPANTEAASGYTFGTIALAVVLGAFAVVAIAAAIGNVYRGEPIEWAACYAQAVRRAGAILLTLLCEGLMFGVVVIAGAFTLGIVMVAAVFAVRGSVPLGVAAFVAVGIVGLLWMAAMLLCYLAFNFAFDALGIEGASFGAALGSGFARIFNRSELLRATLICLALVAIYIGLTIVSLSLATALESMKMHLLYVAVNALVSLVSTSFLGVLIAVYYFDVRVRREGLDMQAQISGLEAAPSSSY